MSIRVTSVAKAALQELWNADAGKARAVEDAIMRIPRKGIPVAVPGAPADRKFWAMIPDSSDAPVVIYRELKPDGHADEGWLVTTLIDQDEYRQYRHAELRGFLTEPVIAEAVAGTVSSIYANPAQDRSEVGGGTA